MARYLWFSDCLVILKSEIKNEMVHNKDSDLLRPIKSFKSYPWRGPSPHTLSHPVDPVLLCSGGKHGDGIIYSETEILPWSMEPSTLKFTVATSAPAVYNVAGLSYANWHFSVHKSPKKKPPPRPILYSLGSCYQSDPNLLIKEDILYSPVNSLT